jgi:hypothetical protein
LIIRQLAPVLLYFAPGLLPATRTAIPFHLSSPFAKGRVANLPASATPTRSA